MRQELSIEYYLSLPYQYVIVEAPGEDVVARVPALPGCVTQAETVSEAFELLKDAKRAWFEAAIEYGDQIPEPAFVAAEEEVDV